MPTLLRWILPLLALSPALAQSPPTVVVNPVSGSSAPGAQQTFIFTFSDPDGAASISTAEVTFTAVFSQYPSCDITYSSSVLWLDDDYGGMMGPLPPNVPGGMSNSMCSLSDPLVNTNGNTLTLTLKVAFLPAFGGAKGVWAMAADNTGPDSGWISQGNWTVQFSSIPPTITFTNTSRASSDSVFEEPNDWWQNIVTGGA